MRIQNTPTEQAARLRSRLFKVSPTDFEGIALDMFRYQYAYNKVYHEFVDLLKIKPTEVNRLEDIPYLPVSLFKSTKVVTGEVAITKTFLSSTTTGTQPSRHLVADLQLYVNSFTKSFQHFYGPVTDYVILALLPSYLERSGSSLVYMIDHFIKASRKRESGFFLYDQESLVERLKLAKQRGLKCLLFGVSYALLDLSEDYPMSLDNTIIMETGGMKGRRAEVTREALHQQLTKAFGIDTIHSEYGMTELLSQAYSKGNGLFQTPPWMRVSTRDIYDPLSPTPNAHGGALNIIDLANLHSSAFIATDDLGKVYEDGSFEVLGRLDHSEIRGCNLMVE